MAKAVACKQCLGPPASGRPLRPHRGRGLESLAAAPVGESGCFRGPVCWEAAVRTHSGQEQVRIQPDRCPKRGHRSCPLAVVTSAHLFVRGV